MYTASAHVGLCFYTSVNQPLFLRFGLPSRLIRHENGAFRRNLKALAFRCSLDGKQFEIELFEKGDITIIMRVP